MSDLSFLDWPFLEPRHRELALSLDAWASDALAEGRIDHHDTDIDRAVCQRLQTRAEQVHRVVRHDGHTDMLGC